jgi:hypothetical protein
MRVPLGQDPILISKICRVANRTLRPSPSGDIPDADLRGKWKKLFSGAILPALSLAGPNLALALEVWTAMKYLPSIERYSAYYEWEKSYDTRPETFVARASTVANVRTIMKYGRVLFCLYCLYLDFISVVIHLYCSDSAGNLPSRN